MCIYIFFYTKNVLMEKPVICISFQWSENINIIMIVFKDVCRMFL